MRRIVLWAVVGIGLFGAHPSVLTAEEEPQPDAEGFIPLFDGKTLKGWFGDEELWRVEDGAIVGHHDGSLKRNRFLIHEESYGSFVLKFRFKLEGGNSGVQFRSKVWPGFNVTGYQADIAPGYWGLLYDEGGRGILDRPADDALRAARLDPDGWNDYTVGADDRRIVLILNNVTTVDYFEEDTDVPREGMIALQLHTGPAMTVRFKDIKIRPLDKK